VGVVDSAQACSAACSFCVQRGRTPRVLHAQRVGDFTVHVLHNNAIHAVFLP